MSKEKKRRDKRENRAKYAKGPDGKPVKIGGRKWREMKGQKVSHYIGDKKSRYDE